MNKLKNEGMKIYSTRLSDQDQHTFYTTEDEVKIIDEYLIPNGFYTSRSEFIRVAIRNLVKEEMGYIKHVFIKEKKPYTPNVIRVLDNPNGGNEK